MPTTKRLAGGSGERPDANRGLEKQGTALCKADSSPMKSTVCLSSQAQPLARSWVAGGTHGCVPSPLLMRTASLADGEPRVKVFCAPVHPGEGARLLGTVASSHYGFVRCYCLRVVAWAMMHIPLSPRPAVHVARWFQSLRPALFHVLGNSYGALTTAFWSTIMGSPGCLAPWARVILDLLRPGTYCIVRYLCRPGLLVTTWFTRGRQDQAPRITLLQAPPLAAYAWHVRPRSWPIAVQTIGSGIERIGLGCPLGSAVPWAAEPTSLPAKEAFKREPVHRAVLHCQPGQ